jgi:hypothetical protein
MILEVVNLAVVDEEYLCPYYRLKRSLVLPRNPTNDVFHMICLTAAERQSLKTVVGMDLLQ